MVVRKTSMERTRRHINMPEIYAGLSHARSVNELLMAAYDALEAHRQIATVGKYPGSTIAFAPPTILVSSSSPSCAGTMRAQYLWTSLEENCRDNKGPHGVFVDFDRSSKLEIPGFGDYEALRSRWTTPMYSARASAIRREIPTPTNLRFKKMPVLSEKAKSVYVKLHGEARYLRYCDEPAHDTYHGGVAPSFNRPGDLMPRANALPYRHHLWYDAESVFWALYATFLRVVPQGAVETKMSEHCVRCDWDILASYTLPPLGSLRDSREQLVGSGDLIFTAAFLPEVQGVAELLHTMAEQVVPCYAHMARSPPFEDHLHEAMQRLILDYLIGHEDSSIPLKPYSFRPVVVAIDPDEDVSDA
ncbi:hypothetical protein GY45DRAFT_252300 [Cubamyces sp. BRFM 1775]|nr:hypothetical protein GY45DRAFT_252300 [Cubamyces sp. BRFM 1775]